MYPSPDSKCSDAVGAAAQTAMNESAVEYAIHVFNNLQKRSRLPQAAPHRGALWVAYHD